MCGIPFAVSKVAHCQRERRQETDRQVGARSGEADRVELAPVQRVGPRLQLLCVLLPGCDGIGFGESRRGGHGVPQALEIRFAEDLRCPAFVRSRHDDPVDVAATDAVEVRLAKVPRLRAAHQGRVEVAEQVRTRVAGERDERGVFVVPAPNPVEHVRSGPAKLLLRAELDRSTPRVQVGVLDDHVLGSGAVRLARNRARDLGMLDEAGYDDVLPGLHVRADADRELGVASQTLVSGQGKRSRGGRGHRGDATGRKISRPSRSRAAGRSRAPRRARGLRPRFRPSPRRATALARSSAPRRARRPSSPRFEPVPRS